MLSVKEEAKLNLVNRSAIWYIRELEQVTDRGDLTVSGALYLLYQDHLVRQKTREAIQESTTLWRRNSLQLDLLHQLAAAGRWKDWFRLLGLTTVLCACIGWLQLGAPIWGRAALRVLVQVTERIPQFSNE